MVDYDNMEPSPQLVRAQQ